MPYQTLTRKVSAVEVGVALKRPPPHPADDSWLLCSPALRYSIIPLLLLRRFFGTDVKSCDLVVEGVLADGTWEMKYFITKSRATFRPTAMQRRFVKADVCISRKEVEQKFKIIICRLWLFVKS